MLHSVNNFYGCWWCEADKFEKFDKILPVLNQSSMNSQLFVWMRSMFCFSYHYVMRFVAGACQAVSQRHYFCEIWAWHLSTTCNELKPVAYWFIAFHSGFDIYFCSAGERITIMIERSLPAVGQVTATWHISAVNSRPPRHRFDIINGSVLFPQVHH